MEEKIRQIAIQRYLKGAVRGVMKEMPKHKFFCKTDVKSYYDVHSTPQMINLMYFYKYTHCIYIYPAPGLTKILGFTLSANKYSFC